MTTVKSEYRVRVKPLDTICEYLHNLKGTVIKGRKVGIYKRLKRSNWDPVRIKTINEVLVDLNENKIKEFKQYTSGKFWFPTSCLLRIKSK